MSEAGQAAAAAAATDTAAQAAAASAAAAAANEPWFKGADAETTGYLQNRGWDKLPARDVAFNAVKAHREAEKLIGAPADQVVRMPKDANDTEAWNTLYSKIGVPADKTKYDVSSVKFKDGTGFDEGFTTAFRDLAAKAHLTPDAAIEVARFLATQADTADAADQAEYETKLQQERTTLQTNWGSNAAVNKVVAENAAAKLGVQPDEIKALEKIVGYARVMEMFRNIGVRTGEDKFVNGGQAGGAMTKEQAQATLAERENDTQWVKKLNEGDTVVRQEWNNLTRIVAGV